MLSFSSERRFLGQLCSLSVPRFALMMCVVFMTLPVTATPIFPRTFSGNGHTYDIVYGSFTRDEAFSDAQDARNYKEIDGRLKKGHLATITTAAEDDFLRSLLRDTTSSTHSIVTAWLDGSWDSSEGGPLTGWSWDTGESFSHAKWISGQPDHKDGKDSSFADVTSYVFDSSSDKKSGWEDNSRSRKDLDGYLIEYEENVPEPGALLLLMLGLGMLRLIPLKI